MLTTTAGPAALLAATLLLTGAPAQADDAGATAAETQAEPGDVTGILIHGRANAKDGSVAVLEATQRTGNAEKGFVNTPLTDSVMTPSSTSYTCVKKTTSTSDLQAYTPSHIDVSNDTWEIHYTDHLYSMGHARYVSGSWTTQFEQCTIGGSRNKTWHRLAHSESEVSIGNSHNKNVGYKWGTGVDNGTVSASLGFEVGLSKTTKISGSLPVTDGGHFQGGVGDGRCGAVGPNAGNQVNAAWDFTYPGIGTASFKGNVGHALYEFQKADKTSFTYYFQACRAARY
jgi:hypothetical protein